MNNIQFEREACPLCGSKKGYNKLIEKNIDHINYTIVKCNNCGFVYVQNPKDSTISDENKSKDEIEFLEPKARHYQVANYIINFAKGKNINQPVKILEIGAGTAPVARILMKNYPQIEYEYLGFEPSIARAELSRNVGINVISGFFDTSEVKSKFDIIIIDNVLEHVLYPKEMINEAKKVLNNNGVILIIVPNLNDIRSKLSVKWRNKNLWIPHVHLNYFTAYHLKQLLRENGLIYKEFPISSSQSEAIKIDLAIKSILDKVGIHLFGLYCIAQSN